MANFNVEHSSIFNLLESNTSYIIPDYQRPYAWTEDECQTLWDDIVNFAFPNQNKDLFNKKDEYFLGPIVVFKNNDQLEVIDGQQRLTTLTLLLRAFYNVIKMKDSGAINAKQNIAKCLWKRDELDEIDPTEIKIETQVATDKDKDEFQKIIQGSKEEKNDDDNSQKDLDPSLTSTYAKNYRFFQNKINEFSSAFSGDCPLLVLRLLKNCILLCIETDSQDSALRVFSTLNNRGKPLADTDIFKAQLYKRFKGQEKEFIDKWKQLEELTQKIFNKLKSNTMNEIFTQYMYYERAKNRIKDSTTESLRKFYEKNDYNLLKDEQVFENIQNLASFWEHVSKQDDKYFSDRILKQLFILNYAPNRMWTYITSVYYMHNKDKNDQLNEENFFNFLRKLTAFIWGSAITNVNLSSLRNPIYNVMIDIIDDKDISFSLPFDENQIKTMFDNYIFSNARTFTKSMLVWYAFTKENQIIPDLEQFFDIEHIYAKSRLDKPNEKPLSSPDVIESLGNKSILEKRINIGASDYRFEDKKNYYKGFQSQKGFKEGTKIEDLKSLIELEDFTEKDINERFNKIKDTFIEELKANNLFK